MLNLLIAHDQTVAQSNGAVSVGGERGIVRDQNQSGAFLAVEFEKDFEYLALSGSAIQVAGRFVGKQDGRFGDERAGESDALLFTAGELNWVMIEAVGKTDASQELTGASGGFSAGSGEFGGQEHVFFGGQGRNELERLKDKADFAASDFGHAVFGEAGDVDTVEENPAFGCVVETREQAEQRAFATAGRSHDGDELAGRNGEVDAAQDFDPVGRGSDGPGQANYFNNGA